MALRERTLGRDSVRIGRETGLRDLLAHRTRWTISRIQDPDGEAERLLRSGADPQAVAKQLGRELAVSELEGNVLLGIGIQYLEQLIGNFGTQPTRWDNTNARVGVGDSSAAANAQLSTLQGSSTAYAPMDTGFPGFGAGSTNVIQWRGTFGAGAANFAWNEEAVSNASGNVGQLVNRAVSAQGTKQSGQTWTLRVDLTLT